MSVRRITVLLVNPLADEREMLSVYLEGRGFLVDAAVTYESALKFAASNTPDVIVCRAPLSIRGSEAMTLAHEIRSQTTWYPTLILLTTDAFTDVTVAINAGYDLVFLLPILPEDLAAAIARFVDRTGAQAS
jgi:DNA-binding response OmpR family regulator